MEKLVAHNEHNSDMVIEGGGKKPHGWQSIFQGGDENDLGP
jgi:hypothetical protein